MKLGIQIIPKFRKHFQIILAHLLNLKVFQTLKHELRTHGEEIAFTARPKIHSHSQIFWYGQSLFCLPHRPKLSGFFDLCLHWVSVVRALKECSNQDSQSSTWSRSLQRVKQQKYCPRRKEDQCQTKKGLPTIDTTIISQIMMFLFKILSSFGSDFSKIRSLKFLMMFLFYYSHN